MARKMNTYTITATARMGWTGTRTVQAPNKTEARKMAHRELFLEAVEAVSAMALTRFTITRTA